MERYKEIKISEDLQGQVVLDYKKDVTYISNNGEELHLQIIIPSATDESVQKKYPCILYLMSKVEEKKDLDRSIPRLTQLAKRGYVIALMETPEEHSTYQKQLESCQLAIKYLVENESSYPISTQNLFILRDGNQEEQLDETMIKDKLLVPENQHDHKIRAIICLGGKDQMNVLEKKIDYVIPPVLMLSADSNKEDHPEFWTEEAIDIMEDFLSSYIE